MQELRAGLVGAGFIAQVHAESLRGLPGVSLAAQASPDPVRGQAFCDRNGIASHHPDLEAMLAARPDLDVVILASPNHLHASQAIAAAQANKHVIIEKPLCLTLKDADAMIQAAAQAGVVLCYAEELCFAPKYVRCKELLAEGAIGEAYRVNQVEKHEGPYSPWFFDRLQAGGGVLMDMGCHSIEFARWLFGKPRATAVTARLATVRHGERTRMEDDAIVILEFETGQSALLESSWALLGGMDSVTQVFGSQGVIHADLCKGQGLEVFSQPGYGENAKDQRGWTKPDFAWSFQNGYPQELAHFFDCIRGGQTPMESGIDGRAVLEIMLAAYASARQGRRILLPYAPTEEIEVPVDLWLAEAGS